MGMMDNLYKENCNCLSRHFTLSLWLVSSIFSKQISKYFINSLNCMQLKPIKEESHESLFVFLKKVMKLIWSDVV